jgi:integral membrane protein
VTALVSDVSRTRSRTQRAFHAVALAEAVSWGALLVAMFFKWVVQDDPHTGIEGGVPIAGPIHGAIFVAYVVTSLVAWRVFRWSPVTGLLALAAGVPPFCTLVFERVAGRRGLLGH